MSRQTVLLYRAVPPAHLERLRKEHEVIRVSVDDPAGKQAFLDALPRVQGLLGVSLKIDESMLDRASQLKVISSISVGVDSLTSILPSSVVERPSSRPPPEAVAWAL